VSTPLAHLPGKIIRPQHRKPDAKGLLMKTTPPAPLDAELARHRIEQEDQLINHRFSWLVGSQSFLLTGFVLLRNNPIFYPVPGSPPLPDAYIARTQLLIYILVITGFMMALCSFIGVVAAFVAIAKWRSRVSVEERRNLTSGVVWNFFGGLAAFLPGPVIASIWILLLTSEWPLDKLSLFQFWTPPTVAAVTLLIWAIYVKTAFADRLSAGDMSQG
jgi:hypothetical protein